MTMITKTSITALMSVALLAMVPAVSEGQSIIIDPYLQNVDQSKMTIMWETDVAATSRVEYGPSYEYFVESSDLVTIHEMEITGLDTQANYNYRVISGSATSNNYTFTTAPYRNTPFRFTVCGDSRGGGSCSMRYGQVCDAMAAQNTAISINVGDLVNSGSVKSQWKEQYFDPMKNLSANVPTYVAIGNHDYPTENYHNYICQPGNERYFATTYGNTRFIYLDSNQYSSLNPGQYQHDWLVSELASTERHACDWTFVSLHHPLYCEGWASWDGMHSFRDDGDPGNGDELQVVFENYGVDMVFNGHTHDYERGLLNGVYYVITGGGGCGLDVWARDFEHITVYESLWHYSMIDIDDNELSFIAITEGGNSGVPDGTVIDSFSIIKPLRGDLNESGFVGQDDLDIVLGEWGQDVTPGAQADPSGDGFIGQDDLDIVLGYWGQSTQPVPEPATMFLLCLGATAMLQKKNR